VSCRDKRDLSRQKSIFKNCVTGIPEKEKNAAEEMIYVLMVSNSW
jgi:hypothetical protein